MDKPHPCGRLYGCLQEVVQVGSPRQSDEQHPEGGGEKQEGLQSSGHLGEFFNISELLFLPVYSRTPPVPGMLRGLNYTRVSTRECLEWGQLVMGVHTLHPADQGAVPGFRAQGQHDCRSLSLSLHPPGKLLCVGEQHKWKARCISLCFPLGVAQSLIGPATAPAVPSLCCSHRHGLHV